MSGLFLKKIALFFVFTVSFISTSFEVAAGEELNRIGQTVVFAAPPPGFYEKSHFPGLVNDALEGSIVVTKSPETMYPEVYSWFSDVSILNKKFSQGNVAMREIETLQSTTGAVIKLAHGYQWNGSGKFEKWMAVFQGKKTAMVTLSVLDPNKIEPDVVRKFFQSIKTASPPSNEDILKSLSFDLNIVPPFHLSGAIGGSGIALMGGPDELNSKNDQPFIFIFHAPKIQNDWDMFTNAEAALRSTSTFRSAKILMRQKANFGGYSGAIFSGETTAENMTIEFKQWFTIDLRGQPLRMVAAGPKQVLEKVEPEIEVIANSVKPHLF